MNSVQRAFPLADEGRMRIRGNRKDRTNRSNIKRMGGEKRNRKMTDDVEHDVIKSETPLDKRG